MIVTEQKLRRMIRQSLTESFVDDITDTLVTNSEEISKIGEKIVAVAKLHPAVDMAFDVRELGVDIYDIASNQVDPGSIQGLTKEQVTALRKENNRKIKELIAERLTTFVIDELVKGQLTKLDAVFIVVLGKNTEDLVEIAFTPAFRKGLIAILKEVFVFIEETPERFVRSLEITMSRVYINTVNSFKAKDKDRFANISKMHRNY